MRVWIWILGLVVLLSAVDCLPKVKRAPRYPVPPAPRGRGRPPQPGNRHEWAPAPGHAGRQDPDVQEDDVVDDPDVGDAGLTAIKDDSLDACFIYHYKKPFVLPSVQRAFYAENLPATFTTSQVDKEEFWNTVGPVVGRVCADKMCFWLDNGLFYQYMTKQLRPHGHGRRIQLPDHLLEPSTTTEFAVPPVPKRRRPFVPAPPEPKLKPTTSEAVTEFVSPLPPRRKQPPVPSRPEPVRKTTNSPTTARPQLIEIGQVPPLRVPVNAEHEAVPPGKSHAIPQLLKPKHIVKPKNNNMGKGNNHG